MKTVNQLLDKFSSIRIDDMTPELGKIRQNLIDIKKGSPNGGLRMVDNSNQIINVINEAKAHNSKVLKAETASIAIAPV